MGEVNVLMINDRGIMLSMESLHHPEHYPLLISPKHTKMIQKMKNYRQKFVYLINLL